MARCLWITNDVPVPTSSPGAGSVVPSAPNSRRRTYSNRAGSFDASAISSDDFAATALDAVRGSGPLGSSSGSTPSASIAGARSLYGPSRTGAHRSPTSAKRSQTLSIRKSWGSKPPAATSSHVSGVDTGARSSGRSE